LYIAYELSGHVWCDNVPASNECAHAWVFGLLARVLSHACALAVIADSIMSTWLVHCSPSRHATRCVRPPPGLVKCSRKLDVVSNDDWQWGLQRDEIESTNFMMRCREKFVAPGKIFPSHNVTNPNPKGSSINDVTLRGKWGLHYCDDVCRRRGGLKTVWRHTHLIRGKVQ